jgi:hypothetical protein
MTVEEIDTELSRLHEELCSTTTPANRRRILRAIDKLLDQRSALSGDPTPNHP